MKRKTLPLSPGDYVEYSNGDTTGTGHIVKPHPNAGTQGSYELKPSDGTHRITRKSIHVRKIRS